MEKKLTVLCPTCGILIVWTLSEYRPFCSKRCSLKDLGAWAEGKYKVPAEEESSEIENTTVLEKQISPTIH